MITSRQTDPFLRRSVKKKVLFPYWLRYGIGLSVLFTLPAQAMEAPAGRTSPVRKTSHRPLSRFLHSIRPFSQKGLASWYEGKKNRKIPRHNDSGKEEPENAALTAAHPFLPLGTKLVVHSPRTGRSVIVRVNDRGPFTGARVIDLSRAAAAKLGILKSGVTQVVVTEYIKERDGHGPEDGASS
ncbi:septal ring lytic transglycosylase RlpA family protein [Acetobacteraceae bacterium ESL0709]|nr:septal ring lytic transglycosylase RlpA family protein [Acetobacteraceae bacterium ESL0697]MDF7677478.1 septal ring lytic transglycosylase RlpA family protein [Acetobacteraceae bacterium ESL0709]